MAERIPMTQDGFRKLQEELKHIKAVERPAIIAAIEEARGHGDLSENAEYDAAKERQQQLDQRMREIEDRLARAQIIRPEDVKGDRVVFGATAVIRDLENERTVAYQLVGQDESNLAARKISVKSPLGAALIGKQVGEVFTVQTPSGEREYQVMEIRFG
ncbi:MAG: transcription elongation factor GreA [Myxococcales bacterium]|nr:transcription elongation factor GreA [Myxococcales bacterium]